jgi:hypothetical protein
MTAVAEVVLEFFAVCPTSGSVWQEHLAFWADR